MAAFYKSVTLCFQYFAFGSVVYQFWAKMGLDNIATPLNNQLINHQHGSSLYLKLLYFILFFFTNPREMFYITLTFFSSVHPKH